MTARRNDSAAEHALRSAPASRVSQPASAGTTRRRRRREKIVLVLLLLALGLGLAVGAAIGPASMLETSGPSATSASEQRTGSILVGHADRCRQRTFDNDTGRFLEASKPCDGVRLDSNGLPIPAGTARRLDAISKSFLKP